MKFKTFRALLFIGIATLGVGSIGGLSWWLLSGDESPEKRPAAALAELPPSGTTVPLTDRDQRILAKAQEAIAGDKIKDAFPDQSWKVNYYKDAGHSKINRAKVDLDRDEKWDEKWTFLSEDGRDEVKRQISPTDDDSSYPLEYRLRSGAWHKKQ